MKRIALSLVFLTACLAPAMQLDPLDERLDLACQAWDGGDYIKALEEFEAVLKSPGGDRFFDRIALVTGELYQTVEITVDGRSARFDPSGRLIAYDAGTRAAPVSRILAADNPGKVLVEVRSASLVFSPAPNMAAFFRIHEVPEIQKLRKEVEYLQSVPPSDRRAFQEKLRQLTWFEAKNSDAVLLDIMTRKEKARHALENLTGLQRRRPGDLLCRSEGIRYRRLRHLCRFRSGSAPAADLRARI